MAIKTFPYSVIYNGEIIQANTPIDIEEETAAKQVESVTISKKENTTDEKPKKSTQKGGAKK